MSLFGSSGNKLFEKLAEKATSPLQLEIDWNAILQMCDVIRQGDAQPKPALNYLKKKLTSDNINVLNYTLHCIESLVKNCGSKVHQEVANKDFMDTMKNLAVTKPDPVKAKVLELIQCWAYAFRKNGNYKIVEDYFNAMKLEGFQYPVYKEADSLFEVEQAPEWRDDTNCFRCRTEFTTFNRKHHCRCCGQIFCGNCSAKTAPIPKFGIEKDVRVCDPCFDKLSGSSAAAAAGSTDSNGLPIEYLSSPLAKQNQAPKPQEKTDEEFEEELQLALALSQSEQEEKNKKRNNTTAQSKFSASSKQSTTNGSGGGLQQDDSEAELNKFLARSAAKKAANSENSRPQQQQQISGPSPPPSAPFVEARLSDENAQEHNDETTQQMNIFMDEVKKFMDIFVTRMKSDQQRGRTITNDTAVQSLFLQLQQMHPKLLAFIKFQEDARAYYESLQDKLTQLKDAREALNALRYEHFEKRRREAEERERLKQLQLNAKLTDMRQKKHLYFKMQTEQNLQRLQEQERELQMRLEQQRMLVSMRDQQFISGLQFPVNQNPVINPYEQQYVNPMYMIPQQQQQQPQQQQQLHGNLANTNGMQYQQRPQQQTMLPPSPQNQQQALYMNQQAPFNMNALNMSLPQQNNDILNQQHQQYQNPAVMMPPSQPQQQHQQDQWSRKSLTSQLPPQQQQQQLYQMPPHNPMLAQQQHFNPQMIPQQQQQQYIQQQPQQFIKPNEDMQLISFD